MFAAQLFSWFSADTCGFNIIWQISEFNIRFCIIGRTVIQFHLLAGWKPVFLSPHFRRVGFAALLCSWYTTTENDFDIVGWATKFNIHFRSQFSYRFVLFRTLAQKQSFFEYVEYDQYPICVQFDARQTGSGGEGRDVIHCHWWTVEPRDVQRVTERCQTVNSASSSRYGVLENRTESCEAEQNDEIQSIAPTYHLEPTLLLPAFGAPVVLLLWISNSCRIIKYGRRTMVWAETFFRPAETSFCKYKIVSSRSSNAQFFKISHISVGHTPYPTTLSPQSIYC